jgi:hypothetical protein
MDKNINEALDYMLLKCEYEPIVDNFNYCLEKLESILTLPSTNEMLPAINSICIPMIGLLEANNVISEGTKELLTLQAMNASSLDAAAHNHNIDNILVYVFLKTLMTVPASTKAYKLGLINQDGKLIKNPKTKNELEAISNLDLLGFKLRKWIKPYISKMSMYSWLNSATAQRYQNRLSGPVDSMSKFYTIKRANDDLVKLMAQN